MASMTAYSSHVVLFGKGHFLSISFLIHSDHLCAQSDRWGIWLDSLGISWGFPRECVHRYTCACVVSIVISMLTVPFCASLHEVKQKIAYFSLIITFKCYFIAKCSRE